VILIFELVFGKYQTLMSGVNYMGAQILSL